MLEKNIFLFLQTENFAFIVELHIYDMNKYVNTEYHYSLWGITINFMRTKRN